MRAGQRAVDVRAVGLLARGKLERHGRNVNLLVASLESLGPLAREAASEAEVVSSLPKAHHFGHR